MSSEERFENRQYNDAVGDIKKAYKQFSKFEWKVELDEPKRAARHLGMAVDDFRSALNHIAKADVGKDQQGAVDDINKGVNELGDAISALENGNMDSAQKHYDKATTEFNKAASILD